MDGGSSQASSGYSSCEGSEFEKYCSANSAFGSASHCSSVESHSEFFESVKSHEENCSTSKKLRWSRLSGDAFNSAGLEGSLDGGIESLSPLTRGRSRSKIPASLPSEKRLHFDENSSPEANGFSLDHNPRSWTDAEADKCASLGCECSEDENSMLDSCSDDEGMVRLSEGNSLRCIEETKPKNGNPLLMNSSVAFGSSDWDEFMLENGQIGFSSLPLYQNQLLQEQQEPLDVKGDNSLPVKDHIDDGMKRAEDARDISVNSPSASSYSIRKPLGDNKIIGEHKLLEGDHSRIGDMDPECDGPAQDSRSVCGENVHMIGTSRTVKKKVVCESELSTAPLFGSTCLQSYPTIARTSQEKEIVTQEYDGTRSSVLGEKNVHSSSTQRGVEEIYTSTLARKEDLVQDEVEELETHDSYNELVLEMEEILLDSRKTPGTRLTQVNHGDITQLFHHSRDGSSTASTSGADDACQHVQYSPKIDWIEIVGAKQKHGDVSFGERLVGVKEYTVYKLRVWSGNDQWEIERRYRDFYALYSQLKTLFTDHGLTLPSPWSNVERESRKIFGNASPAVIIERSNLIQNCLRSILDFKYPVGMPESLISFLSPSRASQSAGFFRALIPQSLRKFGQDGKSNFSKYEGKIPEDISMFGKTISLVVEIKPHKSLIQLLEAQNYKCSGCHKHLDGGKTLLRDIVHTLGWNNPRFCEYTGQLFCSSCHTNETTVLPSKVLHIWDFSLYPVSQLAKAYLESIYDQPMLCVSAVNPFLFTKVPALFHVVSTRKKIGAMLPYVRCPFRRSIQRCLGSRRHLLESNDFFALRDLVDLSKGAFAALPVMLETISNKILEHITQQCLECYDSGVPCAARQACDDPSSLIFPFQEAEAERCSTCGSIFHKHCFGKLMGCPCCKLTGSTAEQPLSGSAIRPLLTRPPDSNSISWFLSDVLSKARPDKIWKPRNRSPVILMGSLPNTGL